MLSMIRHTQKGQSMIVAAGCPQKVMFYIADETGCRIQVDPSQRRMVFKVLALRITNCHNKMALHLASPMIELCYSDVNLGYPCGNPVAQLDLSLII